MCFCSASVRLCWPQADYAADKASRYLGRLKVPGRGWMPRPPDNTAERRNEYRGGSIRIGEAQNELFGAILQGTQEHSTKNRLRNCLSLARLLQSSCPPGPLCQDWSNAISKFIFNATKALAMYQADTLDIILTHLIKAVQECRDLISSQPDAWHKKVESIAVSSLPRTDFLCDTTMLNPHTHALRRIGQLQLLSASWCAWLIA